MKLPLLLLGIVMAVANCGDEKPAVEAGSETKTLTDPAGNSVPQLPAATPAEAYARLSQEEKPVMVLEKTYCFGTCPVYRAELYPNGFLHYTGQANVKHLGNYYARLESSSVESIIQKARDLGFFSLDSLYDQKGLQDVPSTILAINNGNQNKTVTARQNVPGNFRDLVNYLEGIIDQAGLREFAKEAED